MAKAMLRSDPKVSNKLQEALTPFDDGVDLYHHAVASCSGCDLNLAKTSKELSLENLDIKIIWRTIKQLQLLR